MAYKIHNRLKAQENTKRWAMNIKKKKWEEKARWKVIGNNQSQILSDCIDLTSWFPLIKFHYPCIRTHLCCWNHIQPHPKFSSTFVTIAASQCIYAVMKRLFTTRWMDNNTSWMLKIKNSTKFWQIVMVYKINILKWYRNGQDSCNQALIIVHMHLLSLFNKNSFQTRG